MRTMQKDKFIEFSGRTAIRSILDSLKKPPIQPELVEKLRLLLQDLRKPTLDEVSGVLNELTQRMDKAEALLDLVKRLSNVREPRERAPLGPAGVLGGRS